MAALNLTLDECIRVNDSLVKAAKNGDIGGMCDILASLRASDVKGKLKALADSKLGATVSKLGKYQNAIVAQDAAALKKLWAERAAAARSGGAAATADPAKAGGSATAMDTSPTKVEQPEPVIKDEPVPPQPSASSPPPAEAPKLEVKAEVKSEVKAEGANAAAGVPKLERMESSSYNVDWREPRMTHDPARDMVRKKLQEAFDKGKEANEVVLREQMTDTAAMAEQVETSMFELHGGTGNQYKARFRTLNFNLRDPKNPYFIKSVITGQVFITDLADMEVKDMASDEMKKAREQAAERAKMALMDERTYKNYAGKATEDGILKCPKCKSMKTEYVEVQTRSADEPTTKKCMCNNCDYRWKFC